MQPPDTHVSAPLQNWPSSQSPSPAHSGTQPIVALHVSLAPHAVSSGTFRQTSAVSSQRSVVHITASPQLGAVPGMQPPDTHVSAPLQNWPSSQSPSPAHSGTQPIVALHVSLAPHIPSSGMFRHTSAVSSQPSIVHITASPQLGAAPGMQPPDTHVSAPLQN